MNTIKAIIILQTDGRRTLAKYFDDKINPKQFERKLFTKTKTPKAKDEIIVLDGFLIVHKFVTDSHFYIVGGRNENPLVLDNVLNCLTEVVGSFSSNNSSIELYILDNTVLDNLSKVILALDQICDGGLILEVDPNLVLQRIRSSNEDTMESMASRTARRIFGI